MQKWVNNNAKDKYTYNFTWYNELETSDLYNALTHGIETHHGGHHKLKDIKKFVVGGKKYGKSYYNIACSFDIETSKFYVDDVAYSTMYCWQFGIFDTVIMGHTYAEFIDLLSRIKSILKPTAKQR